MAHQLQTRISDTLWVALHERARTSGQSVSHIVQAALADALDVQHHSLFQVSTSGALVNGLYQGCVSVADLRRHGDLGIGTFEDLDGEMILIDGRCYQARADGTVVEADDHVLTPFATVVSFAPDDALVLTDVDLERLSQALTTRRASNNSIESYRITGRFRSLSLRTACRTTPGIDLVTATANQALFEFEDIDGTLVGFWSPEFTKSIAISGYHMHFISDDRQHAGHVLGFHALNLHAEVNEVSQVHLAIPESAEFLATDLSEDHEHELNIVERGLRGR